MSNIHSTGLLFVVATFLTVLSVPPLLGSTISNMGGSTLPTVTTVMITILDCAGNPVSSAVVQLSSLTYTQEAYTNSNGVATLQVPAGTYTVQGGYSTFVFSQTLAVAPGGSTLAVNLGSGC